MLDVLILGGPCAPLLQGYAASEVALQAIVQMLKVNTTITTIDLSRNDITQEGAQA